MIPSTLILPETDKLELTSKPRLGDMEADTLPLLILFKLRPLTEPALMFVIPEPSPTKEPVK